MSNICSKLTALKLSALARVAKFLLFKKRRILFKAFNESNFKYWPLVWAIKGLNKLHGRVLRIIYNDTVTSFEEFLVKDKTFTIHHQNIQSQAIEMYKAVNKLPGRNLSGLFVRNNPNYNIRSKSELTVPSMDTVFKGQNSISYVKSSNLERNSSQSKRSKLFSNLQIRNKSMAINKLAL